MIRYIEINACKNESKYEEMGKTHIFNTKRKNKITLFMIRKIIISN